ncbi:MAG: hypothetical protein LDLANPLL_02696 [Turneriella sp.]|nr:hypothetical protein [Turneriella sp.]
MIQFIYRNRLVLLLGTAILVLLLSLFWPEKSKPGEMQKYYTIPVSQLNAIEYQGVMDFTEKSRVQIHYTITREINEIQREEPLYRVDILKLENAEAKLNARIKSLSGLKTFYAGALVKTIAADWSALDYLYTIEHDAKRDKEYGIKDCTNKLTLTFYSQKRVFCIGNATQSDTRRYILDTEKNKVLITPDFTIRRIQNNIYAQRDTTLYPQGNQGIDTIELKLGKDFLNAFPNLKEKTSGHLTLRKAIKDDGPKKIDVWYVENQLGIKPSHAAEAMQLFTALRVYNPFAINPFPKGKNILENLASLGMGAAPTYAFTGAIKLKKTDKQDIVLTDFVAFAPNEHFLKALPFQQDGVEIKKRDALIASRYNVGYLSADVYPRFTAIFTKFEGDLRAQKEKEKPKEKAQEKK